MFELGKNLRLSRKFHFPHDTIADFAVRCEIGLSTYKKMEKGDLSVSVKHYFKAAKILGQSSSFSNLFKLEEDWFNE